MFTFLPPFFAAMLSEDCPRVTAPRRDVAGVTAGIERQRGSEERTGSVRCCNLKSHTRTMKNIMILPVISKAKALSLIAKTCEQEIIQRRKRETEQACSGTHKFIQLYYTTGHHAMEGPCYMPNYDGCFKARWPHKGLSFACTAQMTHSVGKASQLHARPKSEDKLNTTRTANSTTGYTRHCLMRSHRLLASVLSYKTPPPPRPQPHGKIVCPTLDTSHVM